MISDWLAVCGADNVFGDLPALASTVSLEAVLQADPEVILTGRYAGKGEDWQDLWLQWPDLQAVRAGHLYTVPAQNMERQTPRALQAAREMCRKIDTARRD
jgi:iron complex transport system substrate-binding protein